ncbi:hypothetical protein LY474_22250 [Myxococcus stipitatus]|uniref:hypothetical protein n=1 Tax=Myxococcus stipitatus TaxID=83455 RepID=UPI001F3A94F2|nr:hypothetical protein [Myxococcus stipitatus]MCE9670530.1 hypothetical protein [Myxococcus stipitatus]
MSNETGASIVETFRYVRSIHRNVSRLLMSADVLLSEYGLLPYEGWSASYPLTTFRATAPDEWLAEYFIRQFRVRGKKDGGIVTVGVVLMPPERFSEVPVCFASSMAVRREPNAVYTLSASQVAARGHPPDGVVRTVHAGDLETDWFTSADVASFKELIIDDRVTSVAVPLMTVNSSVELESLVIKPLMRQLAADSAALGSTGS